MLLSQHMMVPVLCYLNTAPGQTPSVSMHPPLALATHPYRAVFLGKVVPQLLQAGIGGPQRVHLHKSMPCHH